MSFVIYNIIRTQERDNRKDSKTLIVANPFMVADIRYE